MGTITTKIIMIAVNIYRRPYLSHELTLVVEQRNIENPDFGLILEGREVVLGKHALLCLNYQ